MTLTPMCLPVEALHRDAIEDSWGRVWSAYEQWFVRAAGPGEPLLAEDLAWPGRFRRISRALLRLWGLPNLFDGVDTALTETVTNALIHGGGGDIGVRTVRTDTGVWIEVADSAPPASPTLVGPDAEHGRGLLLVEAVSDLWGIRDRDSGPGKWTWAFFATTAGTERPR